MNAMTSGNIPHCYFLPFTTTTDHSSAAQTEDWQELFGNLFQTTSKLSSNGIFGVEQWREVIRIVKGAGSDHANDQLKMFLDLFVNWKKQVDREFRGDRHICSLTPLEALRLVHAQLHQDSDTDDPAHAWDDTLPLDEQARFASAAWRSICVREGEAAYNALEPEEQLEVDTMVWTGCAGHKSSNATAAGFQAMSAAWKDIPGATPPLKLLNKDNAAAAARGNVQERTRLEAMAKGGACKTAETWGTLCKNQNDKKGYQDAYRASYEVCHVFLQPFRSESASARFRKRAHFPAH
jgi:hypothetical protein